MDIIYYTDNELNTINNGCYLLLEIQGDERGGLHQIIYIQRLITMYELYNKGVKMLYNDLYASNDANSPSRISTLTIAIHHNFCGFSFIFERNDAIFREKFIQYLTLIRTPFIELETGSIYVEYQHCESIGMYEMWKDLNVLEGEPMVAPQPPPF